MSSEEYWHGPPRLCRAYREAAETRRQMDYDAEWRLGIYVHRAVAAALEEAFSKSPQLGYFEEPAFSVASEREAREEARARRDMERNKARLQAMAEAINRRLAEQAAKDREGDASD